jgi:hypothetical protein
LSDLRTAARYDQGKALLSVEFHAKASEYIAIVLGGGRDNCKQTGLPRVEWDRVPIRSVIEPSALGARIWVSMIEAFYRVDQALEISIVKA